MSGSPPRMRGKVSSSVIARRRIGITPAYAGKRATLQRTGMLVWDHPRVCGEKLPDCAVETVAWGSPPRMRGKEWAARNGRSITGITPAYAGKSGFSFVRGIGQPDHPRVCGEKVDGERVDRMREGSPPRMRGKDSESLEIQVLLFSSAHFSFNF